MVSPLRFFPMIQFLKSQDQTVIQPLHVLLIIQDNQTIGKYYLISTSLCERRNDTVLS